MAVSSALHYHKVCITGQAGVGKTSFFTRIRTGRFQREISTSLGVDTHEVIRTVKDKDLGVRNIQGKDIFKDLHVYL